MLGCAPAASLSPQTPLDELVHAQWGVQEGAPSDVWATVQTTVQTTDAWVWFGGSHGLVRFDGVSFEHVETAPGTADASPAVSDLRALESGERVVGPRISAARPDHVPAFADRDRRHQLHALALDFDGGALSRTSRHAWLSRR